MAEEAPETTEGKKKGSRKFLILIILVLVLGGGGAGGFFYMKSRAAEAAHAKQKKSADKMAEGNKGDAADEGEEAGEEGGDAKGGGVIALDSFIANLADPEGDRYIKCTVRLAVKSTETAEKIKADDLTITKLRDRILTILTKKTSVEVVSGAGKDEMRQEILDGVNEILKGKKIVNVYYTEFIVQ
jgi:flagellar FliL protein